MTLTYSQAQVRTDILPSRKKFTACFNRAISYPSTTLADLETPVSVYLKLSQMGQVSFLLESVEGGEHVGRYSFLGVNPKGVITVKDGEITRTYHGEVTTRPLAEGEDPLHSVEARVSRVRPSVSKGLPRFVGGAVGNTPLTSCAISSDCPSPQPANSMCPIWHSC